MHLTLVISSLNSGGAERVMSTLANAWCALGRKVTILTTHDGGRSPDYSLHSSVRLISVDPQCVGFKQQIRIVRMIREQIKIDRPNAVVSFLNYTNIMVLVATRGLGVPVVVSERIDPSVLDSRKIWSLLRRLTYRWSDMLVVQTPTAEKYFDFLPKDHLRIIPNPVFELTTDPGANDPTSINGPTFLAVGRLKPQKGFDFLIRAMALVRKKKPEWQLIILGEGDSRPFLEKIIEDLGQKGAISLHGRVRNPWPWLLASDVFVMSSNSEGFPNALCEAMVAGLPVISTDCPSGPADLISHGKNGFLVPVGDVEAMVDGMLQLSESSALRTKLGTQAKQIGTNYKLPVIFQLWDDVIKDVAIP